MKLFSKVVLAARRLLAFRHFPAGSPKGSYCFLRFYAPMTASRGQVLVYELDDKAVLTFEQSGAAMEAKKYLMELSDEHRGLIFGSLRRCFPQGIESLQWGNIKDATSGSMFAYDHDSGWTCAVIGRDCTNEGVFGRLRQTLVQIVEQIIETTDQGN